MKNKINTLRKTKGFTLIELIVVIAIIGILIGIAVPQYSKFIGQAQEATVDADAKTLYTAYMAAIATDPQDTYTGYTITNELAGLNLTVADTAGMGVWGIDTSLLPDVRLTPPLDSPGNTFGFTYTNGVRD